MKRMVGFGVAALVVAGGAYLGWQWYRSWDTAFSEKPQRISKTADFDVQRSTIQPSLTLPYEAIAAAANQAADKFAVPMSGRARVDCKRVAIDIPFLDDLVLFDGCLDIDWDISASRNGTINVARVGDGLSINVPVQFSGGGGPNGAIADLLSLSRKNFSGAFVAGVQGQIVLDEQFCPRIINPSAQFNWTTEASIEIIGRSCAGVGRGFEVCIGPWRLPVGDLLTPTIQSKLNDQIADINSKLPCGPMRAELEKIWQKHSIPLAVDKLPPMFVNINPVGLSIPGVIAEDAGVRLTARLDADVAVSTQKGEEGPAGGLPTNTPLPDTAGRMSLAIPFTADYATLEKVANQQIADQIAKKALTVDTPAGVVTVTPTSVEVYPSGERLAVGIGFDADIPGQIFDASGTLWLTALLEPAADGRALQFSDVQLTRKIDNEFWSTVTAILASQLPSLLEEHSKVDFGKDIDAAVAKAQEILADPAQTKGVHVTARNVEVKLNRITPTENALVVEGILNADVDASLPAISF